MDGLMLELKDGELILYEEPYMTVGFETEDDYNYMIAAVEKQKPMKAQETQSVSEIEYICPRCDYLNNVAYNYCYNCGQAIMTSGTGLDREQIQGGSNE